jgi:hypothetical protein
MKIVAFLQNQWFRDPERIKRIIERTTEREATEGQKDAQAVREYYISSFLFMGCVTGRRLKQCLGEELCDDIVWEEISKEVGGQSSAVFPADLKHMRFVIDRHRPDVVLAFGKAATDALKEIRPACDVISGPHPAARFNDILQRLYQMKREVEQRIAARAD